jgi:hypothetical protein
LDGGGTPETFFQIRASNKENYRTSSSPFSFLPHAAADLREFTPFLSG